MINRVLIRSKVLQMVYAYYQSDDKDLAKAEKEFLFSLEKSYELYHYLLLLITDITHYAEQRIDAARNKYLPTSEELNPNTRFIDNRFAAQLRNNKSLIHYCNNHKISWVQHNALIKNLYEQIIASTIYSEYMNAETCQYEDDKEIWRKIVKQLLSDDEELSNTLEELSIYWIDDLNIVSTFVVKTIKRFEESAGENQALLPMFKDEDDRLFAQQLFHSSIEHAEEYRQMITESVKNWEMERIALMDLIIMQIALAEIMGENNIPLSVSFNEYIDLAKIYSTEKSSLFINGTLDNLVQSLKKENKLLKA